MYICWSECITEYIQQLYIPQSYIEQILVLYIVHIGLVKYMEFGHKYEPREWATILHVTIVHGDSILCDQQQLNFFVAQCFHNKVTPQYGTHVPAT